MRKIIFILVLLGIPGIMNAQDNTGNQGYKKVWEFGLGFNVQQLNRATLNNFNHIEGNGNYLSIDNRSALFGFNIAVARELNSHFYLDFQSNFDFASDPTIDGHKTRFSVTPAIGVQWKLGSYMKNKVIDPFVRGAVGYQFRNFNVQGTYDVSDSGMIVEEKSRNISPIIFGVGTNLWITNNWGVSLEADYQINPQSGVNNQWLGVIRLTYRLGGKPILCY